MAELDKLDIYACALPMPSPDNPIAGEWTAEIARNIEINPSYEIYLVGHSLGVPAILHYLQQPNAKQIAGSILVSGPIETNPKWTKINNFMEGGFDWDRINANCKKHAVIHGDNDQTVPLSNAEKLSVALGAKLVVVKNGGHLNGSSGFNSLPQVLEALREMMSLS